MAELEEVEKVVRLNDEITASLKELEWPNRPPKRTIQVAYGGVFRNVYEEDDDPIRYLSQTILKLNEIIIAQNERIKKLEAKLG